MAKVANEAYLSRHHPPDDSLPQICSQPVVEVRAPRWCYFVDRELHS